MNYHVPRPYRILAIFAISLLTLPFAVQGAERSASFRAALESITGMNILAHDQYLASDKLEGREAGTPGGAEARKYLIEQYTQFKLQPGGEDGKFEQPLPPNYCNVVGVIPGRDSELKNEYVLAEAHYDHVGHGQGMSFDPGGIHPGADDNGSGTSGLIELVHAFSLLNEPPRRSVLILSTDGEEKGLFGSKHWANHPTVPIEKVVAGMNMDMIGYLRDDKLYVYGMRTGAGWRRLVSEQNDELRMKLDFTWDFQPDSDHYPMFEKGIPMLMLHTGLHDNYHRTTDTADKLNAAGMSRVVRLAFGILYELAERPERLAYRANAKRENKRTESRLAKENPTPPSRLGIALDSFEKDDSPGVRIAKVDNDSPAARAGLKEDDRILQFAGREVKKADDLIGAVATADPRAKALVKSPAEEKSREVEIELSGHPLRLGITWRTDEAEPKTLILTHVLPGTPAAFAGLKRGDRVYQLAGRDFADENEFIRLAGETSDSLDLLIERNGQTQLVHLDLKAPAPLKQAA